MIEGDAVVHEVRYARAIDVVWQAITDPAALAAWLMPNDFLPEPGHRFHLDARPSFGFVEAEVVDVHPPTLLRCTWTIDGVATIVTIRLRELDGETVLRLEHERAPLDAGFDEGWSDKLHVGLNQVLGGTRDPAQSRVREGLYRHPDLAVGEA